MILNKLNKSFVIDQRHALINRSDTASVKIGAKRKNRIGFLNRFNH